VSASYRLAPHASLREILDDNAAALAFCRAELPAILRDMAAELGKLPQAAAVDIDTYVLGGDSAGGTLALIGGHLLRPRPAAIIESCAVTDLINYHPTSPAAYPPSGAFPDAELRALLAERDPRKAVIAAPYLSEIPPPLGMGRLPRPQLGAVWGASDGPVHDGPHGPEADFSEEEVRFAAMRNDAANLALRDRLTIPTLFRAEKYNSLPELTDAVIELCPLHLLGGMGCPPTETSREYPPTYILHGTHDSGVPMHEAKRYAARLTELRRPVGLKVVEGKGHAFDIWAAPGHALWPTMQHGVDFVDQHVRAARKDPSARL
jgi:acetyl esterase/lipase